jgi:glycosyltransferase involved in cell wall biosynthesis
VIDDGSTDGTGKILKKYGDRIKYIFQENSGPASARNKGLKIARGEYIAFLDADDIWLPAKLEKQISLFRQRKNLGMVTTGACSFDEKGVYNFSTDKRKKLMQGDIAKNIFLYSDVGTPTVMARKRVFDDIGLFDESIRYGEDDNMWIRIASHYEVELIDEILLKVRNHPRRLTLNKSELLEDVQRNVQMLKSKYGEKVRRKIEKAIPRKIAQVQFAIGYSYYERGGYSDAKKSFRKGAYQWIWYWKNPLYYMLTFIPPRFASLLRSLKRKLVSGKTENVERNG